MSKIESRDFWVSDEALAQINGKCEKDVPFISQFVSKNAFYKNKVTISWEAPEKVVAISEKDFNEAYMYEFGNTDSATYKRMKEKLFKGKE